MEEARKAGAVAMFGEKYGERVRQVFVPPAPRFPGGAGVADGSGAIGAPETARDISRACGGCPCAAPARSVLPHISRESVAAEMPPRR
jgi:alanyl-tRNA synthetase